MSNTYDQRKRPQGRQDPAPEPAAAPGPDLRALMTGAAGPTAAQKGRSIDLDAAMKAKMEHAFGDLSGVKLYESRAVGEAGPRPSPGAARSPLPPERRISPPGPARSCWAMSSATS